MLIYLLQTNNRYLYHCSSTYCSGFSSILLLSQKSISRIWRSDIFKHNTNQYILFNICSGKYSFMQVLFVCLIYRRRFHLQSTIQIISILKCQTCNQMLNTMAFSLEQSTLHIHTLLTSELPQYVSLCNNLYASTNVSYRMLPLAQRYLPQTEHQHKRLSQVVLCHYHLLEQPNSRQWWLQ